MENDTNKEFVFLNRAFCYDALANVPSALNELNKLLAIAPNNSEGVVLKGILLFESQGKAAAMSHFNEALTRYPVMAYQVLLEMGIFLQQ